MNMTLIDNGQQNVNVKEILFWQWWGLPKDWFVVWDGGTTNIGPL